MYDVGAGYESIVGIEVEIVATGNNTYKGSKVEGMTLDFTEMVVNDGVSIVGVSVNMGDEVDMLHY